MELPNCFVFLGVKITNEKGKSVRSGQTGGVGKTLSGSILCALLIN